MIRAARACRLPSRSLSTQRRRGAEAQGSSLTDQRRSARAKAYARSWTKPLLAPPARRRGGFTLLELVVVVGILAAIAGMAAVMLSGAEAQASTDIARAEMGEIKQAILRFKADTGFLPKQGPFALEPVPPATGPGKVPLANIPGYVTVDQAAWFDSPANLWQLLATEAEGGSLLPVTNALASWSPSRRRGWRGPYLSRSKKGYVAIGGSGAGSLKSNGVGDPTKGTLLEVMGLADPFTAPPLWDSTANARTRFFEWRPTTPSGPGAIARESEGRPYLLVDVTGLNRRDPLLIGLGPNGVYESEEYRSNPLSTGDDLIAHILQ